MLGLIIKDLLNLRKQCKIFILLIVLYLIMSISSKDLSFFMAMTSIVMVMLPITALGYDERSKFEKYALTMPVSRNDLVKSKYILGGMLAVTAFGINLIVDIFGYFALNIEITQNSIYYTVLMLCISLLFTSIMLPINFRFGVEKGRYFLMIVALIPTLLILVGKNIFPGSASGLEDLSDRINNLSLSSIVIYMVIISIIIYVLSIFISMKIYKKKEF